MEVRAVTPSEVSQLSALSVSLGNVPLFPGKCAAGPGFLDALCILELY